MESLLNPLTRKYYKFKELCKRAENEKIIYDEELYRIYKARYNKERYYDEKTQKEYLMSDFEKKRDSQQKKISDRITVKIFYIIRRMRIHFCIIKIIIIGILVSF